MIPPFVMKFIEPFAKYALIGIAAWFIYGEVKTFLHNRDVMIEDNGKYQVSIEIAEKTIKAKEVEIAALVSQSQEQANAVIRQAETTRIANDRADTLEKLLAKHDLDKLAAGRPTLIEKRINTATAAVFNRMHEKTAELVRFVNAELSNMPTTDQTVGAAGTEPPGS